MWGFLVSSRKRGRFILLRIRPYFSVTAGMELALSNPMGRNYSFQGWKPFAILSIFLILIAGSLEAKDFRLYHPEGDQVTNYEAILEEIEPGRDAIIVSDGTRFEVRRFLDKGNTSYIFEDQYGRAVRIPLGRGFFRDSNDTYLDYLSDFIPIYKQAKKDKIPTVKIYPRKSKSTEYIVSELVDIRFSLHDYILDPDLITEAERPQVNQALESFARKTWKYTFMSDFRPTELVYTQGGEWKIIDLTSAWITIFSESRSFNRETVFQGDYFRSYISKLSNEKESYPPEVLDWLTEAALNERYKRTDPFSFKSRVMQRLKTT
jgi:hypothetical protein